MARDFPDSYAPEPINRVAARVIATGTHHEFNKPDNCREVWETPPETVPLHLVPEPIKRLLGTRKGQLVVVGYLGRVNDRQGRKKKQRLLVRCDCGRYEVRIAQKWRDFAGNIDAFNLCQFCELREKLKISHLPFEQRDRIKKRIEDAALARLGL